MAICRLSDLVLWLFMPIVLLLVLWQLVSVAVRMGRAHADLCRLTAVLGDSIKEQTSALHHLRDKIQASLQAIPTSVDSHRDGVQQVARDTIKVLEAFDRHTQGGAADIQKHLANLYDRLGKLITLRPGAGLEGTECTGENP